METDIRLVAKIYRAIGDTSPTTKIDESKCARIATLIAHGGDTDNIEGLIEQYADRIESMPASDFVHMLRKASRVPAEHAEA
jgi:hypothetical protein